jgi:hypothetical protein
LPDRILLKKNLLSSHKTVNGHSSQPVHIL